MALGATWFIACFQSYITNFANLEDDVQSGNTLF